MQGKQKMKYKTFNKKIYLRRTMHPPFHAIAKSQQARLLLKMGKKNAILA